MDREILLYNYPLSCRTPSVHALRWDPWGSCEDSVYCRPYSLFGWGIVGYPQFMEINAKGVYCLLCFVPHHY